MPSALKRTPVFRRLRAGIGFATYRLNTTIVGLELVAAGGDKPPSLPIKWDKPKTLAAARQISDQARIFVVTSALVYVVDAFDSFLRDLTTIPWLNLGSATDDLVTKAVTEKGGHAYSVLERVQALCDELGVREDVLVAMADLLVAWRNALVHGTRADFKIGDWTKRTLRYAADDLATQYAAIDINQTIKTFSDGRHPMTKDATTLIAGVQNLSKVLDDALLRRAIPDTESADRVALELIKDHFNELAKNKPDAIRRVLGELVNQNANTRKANFAKLMIEIGITDTTSSVATPISAGFLSTLTDLSIAQLITTIGISLPEHPRAKG